jgi:hypothetical protein
LGARPFPLFTKKKKEREKYLITIRAFIVYTLTASLLLYGIAIVFPEIIINVWIVSCLYNFSDGLHFTTTTRFLSRIKLAFFFEFIVIFGYGRWICAGKDIRNTI